MGLFYNIARYTKCKATVQKSKITRKEVVTAHTGLTPNSVQMTGGWVVWRVHHVT